MKHIIVGGEAVVTKGSDVLPLGTRVIVGAADIDGLCRVHTMDDKKLLKGLLIHWNSIEPVVKILLHVEDGLLQDVQCNLPVRYLLLDMDNFYAENERTVNEIETTPATVVESSKFNELWKDIQPIQNKLIELGW